MIKPWYYKGERGNKPYDLELILKLYLIQNLYNLADEATAISENALSRSAKIDRQIEYNVCSGESDSG